MCVNSDFQQKNAFRCHWTSVPLRWPSRNGQRILCSVTSTDSKIRPKSG
ncbi:unnamed protein product [Tenebrio molitor]|nr:unnamed protein product [Tenebrio molitor]